jgi:hypothetical protein
MRQEREEIR